MSDQPKSPGASGANDPWEQLAEELFGLEFGKEHSSVADENRESSPPVSPKVPEADRE
jgi:hypothetical protein